MVGGPIQNQLVGAGEILQGFEVLFHRTDTGVEDTLFDLVCILGFAGGHQQIAHSPGVIGHIAGFVGLHIIVVQKELIGAVQTVGEHLIAVDLFVGLDDRLQVFLLAGAGIENGAQLGIFVVGDTVGVGLLGRELGLHAVVVFALFVVLGKILFCHVQKSFVAGFQICPEHDFHIQDIPCLVVSLRLLQVVTAHGLHKGQVSCGGIFCHHGSEKDHMGPTVPTIGIF